MKPEKKKTRQMQYNYSSLAVEMQLGNPSSNKTFFIVQQGEVSLLRVAYF